MIITPNDTPYVAWDQWDEAAESVDIYVRRWNGSEWEEAGLGSASGGGISSTGHGYHSSIAGGLDGTLYAVWSDNYSGGFIEIYVRRYCEQAFSDLVRIEHELPEHPKRTFLLNHPPSLQSIAFDGRAEPHCNATHTCPKFVKSNLPI